MSDQPTAQPISQPIDQPVNQSNGQSVDQPIRRSHLRKHLNLKRSPIRNTKYVNLPKDCPYSMRQIREFNRQHDRKLKEIPHWMVVAPAWLDKEPDDELEASFKLMSYHQAIDAQRNARLLRESIADQQKIDSLAQPKPQPEQPAVEQQK